MVKIIRATFHGTPAEARALLVALNNHCECDYDDNGLLSQQCEGHHAVETDQRTDDGLVWMRRMRPQLRTEEGLRN